MIPSRIRRRLGLQPVSRKKVREVNPSPGDSTEGWTCSDCGQPAWAFGHLHRDGWHDAVSPDGMHIPLREDEP